MKQALEARLAEALGLAGTDALDGIGIDFAPLREVRAGALRFYLTQAERDQMAPDDALRLWTVKEALFKADPANRSALLADFELADPRAHAGWARRRGDSQARFRYASIALPCGIVSAAVRIRGQEDICG